MKNIILFLFLLSCLSLNAQRRYDPIYIDNMGSRYDEIIEDREVVRNVLVVHQPTINYYHVNGAVRENHYTIGNYHRRYQTRRVRTRSYCDEGQYTPVREQYHQVEEGNKWFFIFQYNSAYLTNKEELAHLINYAKSNPSAVFYIDSYADAETGTPEYNMDISKRRANSVISILLNEGINSSRLFVNNHGCVSQEYRTNNLNRCVIVKAEYR